MTPTDGGWRPWDGDAPWGPAIPVQDGLVARSARGQIGEQWWSRRFLEVMESFALGGRLTRGKTYARKGQVVSLEVGAGEVGAVVQGSRVTPYRVRIRLKPFSKLVWAKAEVVLAEQAIHSARLLAGDFPPELEPVFTGIGAPLFPRRLDDLTMTCSCPDHAVPCKHVAAVFYLLAERFDDDPFLVLRWRGRGREELLDRIRELRGDVSDGDDEAPRGDPDRTDDEEDGEPPEPPVLSAATALTGTALTQASGSGVLGFWTAGEPLPLPSQARLPVDLLLRSLPPPSGALGGTRLIDQLTPWYEELA